MPRPDTGSFNRLLTSVGLILLAAALVIPYFYFQNNDTLMVEKARLEGLTDTARDSIEDRQDEIASVQPFVLPMAGGLVLAGVGLLLWGGYRLRSAQERDDREAEARTIMAEAGVRDLTPEEEKEMIAEDAATPEPPPDSGDTEAGPPATTEPVPAAARTTPPRGLSRESREERTRTALRIRQKIAAAFARAELEHYLFRPQVAVGNLKLDGLFIATDELLPDIVLDVAVGLPLIFQIQIDRTLSRVVRYEVERGRPCLPWIVVVVPEAKDGEDTDGEEIDAAHQRLQKALGDFGEPTVIRENEISKLPIAFESINLGSRPDPRRKRVR